MNRSKIYFIGRKQGFGRRRWRISHLENRRLQEMQGLKAADEYIIQTRFISLSDAIWVRLRPEFTTDNEIKRIDRRLNIFRSKKVIINDVTSFYNYDSKDRTFKIWKNENILCPDFLSISLNDIKNDFQRLISDISGFVDTYGKVLIRTNNETAANGMYVLDRKTSKDKIIAILKILAERCKTFINYRKDTRIILVEFIKPEFANGLIDLYRVHLLFDDILSYYAVTSNHDVFHNCDMKSENLRRFINLNTSLPKIIKNNKKIIIKAANVLGCNLGAVEFFIKNGELIFLEFNPMWGGQASKVGFGDSNIQSHLKQKRKELAKKIPNIYSFLDYENYYKNLYKKIHLHHIKNYT